MGHCQLAGASHLRRGPLPGAGRGGYADRHLTGRELALALVSTGHAEG